MLAVECVALKQLNPEKVGDKSAANRRCKGRWLKPSGGQMVEQNGIEATQVEDKLTNEVADE